MPDMAASRIAETVWRPDGAGAGAGVAGSSSVLSMRLLVVKSPWQTPKLWSLPTSRPTRPMRSSIAASLVVLMSFPSWLCAHSSRTARTVRPSMYSRANHPSSQSAPSTPGTLTPSRLHRIKLLASASNRCFVSRLSRVGCRYGFGGRYLTTAEVCGERNVVLYTSASAPWVMGVRSACEKGAGRVCSGREVFGAGGGSIG